jgi:hypothetical protein
MAPRWGRQAAMSSKTESPLALQCYQNMCTERSSSPGTELDGESAPGKRRPLPAGTRAMITISLAHPLRTFLSSSRSSGVKALLCRSYPGRVAKGGIGCKAAWAARIPEVFQNICRTACEDAPA